MKKIILLLLLVTATYAQINFNDYFHKKTLRIDYIHIGDKFSDDYVLDELREEPYWGGSQKKLLDIFDFGKYKVEVRDSNSSTLIYSRCYSTLFSEWQTTEEAKQLKKGFTESVVVPFPKKKVIISFYSRNKQNIFEKKFEFTVNPKDYFISKERRKEFKNFQVHNSGDPSIKVDIVIIPEGYTVTEMDSFKNDCKKFANYLFNASPYKENKDRFNIWGIEAPSEESGTDIPGDLIWKKTLLNSSFYTFDVERYLMVNDYKVVRDAAANAPYDQIYILVNTKKYGGGSIYNFYNVAVNRNQYEEYVFVHEFGHGFAFLADEYYDSETAYQDFYPINLEPLERNLTTLVNFESKWKNLIDKDIPTPTPNSLEYQSKIGLFEGGGYVAKGVYRPSYDCSMKSISVDNFCAVCKETILKMIEFYSE
jgi:hypothetical protein